MNILYGIYGASGCGRGVMPLARQQVVGENAELVFIDDGASDEMVNGHKVMAYEAFLAQPHPEKRVCVAVANSAIREKLVNKLDNDGIHSWAVMASNLVTMDDIELGEGSILCPSVTLTSNIRIGRSFHANIYSYVEHDCQIGDFVTFAPRVSCNGNVRIEDHAYIGAGAVIKQGTPDKPLVIGRCATVGMGAVVTKDVPPGAVVVGNPARPLEKSTPDKP